MFFAGGGGPKGPPGPEGPPDTPKVNQEAEQRKTPAEALLNLSV